MLQTDDTRENGTRRQLIAHTISDMVLDFLEHDREEDGELPGGSIDTAIEAGEVTVDEMVDLFRRELIEGLGLSHRTVNERPQHRFAGT